MLTPHRKWFSLKSDTKTVPSGRVLKEPDSSVGTLHGSSQVFKIPPLQSAALCKTEREGGKEPDLGLFSLSSCRAGSGEGSSHLMWGNHFCMRNLRDV